MLQQDFFQTKNSQQKNKSRMNLLTKMQKEKDDKIRELQLLEQNLQNLLLQREIFQAELFEIQSALKELENSGEDVFKIVGQIMIKTDKSKVKEELLDKEKILNLRVKSIENQENSLAKKLEKFKTELIN